MPRHPEILVKPLHGEPFRFAIDKDVISIGRSKRNDLVLADQWLSRHHAEIRIENDTYFIRDLESRNGTMVNGVRINEQITLRNSDVVTLGDQTLTFVHETSGSVILSEGPSALDVEGTVVVPTEQLIASARAQEDTWDNLAKRRGGRVGMPDEPSRILKQNQILTALSQASMALISDRPVNELLEFILELAFKVIKAERGVLMLKNGSKLEVEAVRSSSGKDDAEEIAFSRSIADKVIKDKVSILTNNAMTDPRFRSQDSIVAVGIRSAMCVPLWNEQAVSGLIYVDSLIHENVFTQDDLTLLTSLANVAAIKLENARLLEAMIEKKRMDRELELAGDIQQSTLPSSAPELEGWDLVGYNIPCYTVGGDYFDFIERPNGIAVTLGDVSGKGTGAALMMMVLRATVHLVSSREESVEAIISQTNGVMYDNSPQQFYVTFFFGDLETQTGKLHYINAGHLPPILYRAGTKAIERLEVGGTVLGMFDVAAFEVGHEDLEPGDIFIVFSDGISEAWGEDGEEFGEERLGELLARCADLSADEIRRKIDDEVDAYTNGSRATDDRTLIVVKRT